VVRALATGVQLPFPDDLQIPELVELRIVRPDVAPVDDVEEAAREAVLATIAPELAAGREVAVGAGSRGMAGRVELVRGAWATAAAAKQPNRTPRSRLQGARSQAAAAGQPRSRRTGG